MNLERIVSSLIYGGFYKDVIIGDNVYSIQPPTVREFAKILEIVGVGLMSSLSENISQLSESDDKKERLIRIVEIATKRECGAFDKAEIEDLEIAFNEIINIVFATDYFAQVPKVSSKKDKKTESTGGHTFAGQIASFMEDLGMSLNEVLDTSYPLLLMLQHDKPRPDYTKDEDKVVEISGKEMAKRKNGNN